MKNLIKLLEWAKSYKMTEREREAQRRSFVYGNANLHNPNVTRELVDQIAEEMCTHPNGFDPDERAVGLYSCSKCGKFQ